MVYIRPVDAAVHCTHLLVLSTLFAYVHSIIEVPKFSQLQLLYPGWKHHGGDYHDSDIMNMIGATNTRDFDHAHNTASLRMSWTLNRYGGRHSIGTQPIYLSQVSRDSFTGSDGIEYIYRNTAFGPFLALKYGNPAIIRLSRADSTQTMAAFEGKQGIARFVSYHSDHAGGHIALWDCNHFHQSRDWTTEHHIISVEFWETPDSYCAKPRPESDNPIPHMEPLSPGSRVISRHNLDSTQQRQLIKREQRTRHLRKKVGKVHETLWVQDET